MSDKRGSESSFPLYVMVLGHYADISINIGLIEVATREAVVVVHRIICITDIIIEYALQAYISEKFGNLTLYCSLMIIYYRNLHVN